MYQIENKNKSHYWHQLTVADQKYTVDLLDI